MKELILSRKKKQQKTSLESSSGVLFNLKARPGKMKINPDRYQIQCGETVLRYVDVF